jgi:hypothetical protein
MKDQLKHYRLYKRIMKAELEQSLEETVEFKIFFRIYPRISESIRLKRRIRQLDKKLKSKEYEGSEFKIKRSIALTKSKLRKNNLFKRLHGENKTETLFQKKLKRKRWRSRSSLFLKKIRTRLGQPFRKAQKKQGRSVSQNLPPSLFNLRVKDMTERGMVLREWLHAKRENLREKVIYER